MMGEKMAKHRYELFMSSYGWTLVDLRKGEEWKLDDYDADKILKDNPYGEMAFKNREIKAIPIPNELAKELMEHITELLLEFDLAEEE